MQLKEYLQYDGLGLAELVAKKQVSAKELLQVALARAEQTKTLNCITISMQDYAETRAKTHLTGPFAGVPFLVKDLYQEYEGYPSTYGCKAFKRLGYIAETTSEIVHRWNNAGIITFGRTNTPEFGIKGITEPDAWGTCKNPWNLKHNSGGSSGGSASAVAAGIVPLAGASDGGGSIRIPASYCGLFGLKPSRGRTPWGPHTSEAMHGAAMQHVLTKSVRDSAAMLDATQGEDAHSLFKIPAPHESYLKTIQRPPKKLRIGFCIESPIDTKISEDAKAAVLHTAKLLTQLGHDVVEAKPAIDGMSLAKDFIVTWFSQFTYAMDQIRKTVKVTDADFELDSLAIEAFGARTTATQYLHTLEQWGTYVAQMNTFFSQYDLFLLPATASVAPKNGEVKTPSWQKPILKGLLKLGKAHILAEGKLVEQMIRENLKWVPFTQLANITGLPAMSVPLYWNKAGLPLGSQFIAPFAREDVLLQLAVQLEQAQPWWWRYQEIKI
ncbi:amidase [Acinetobacter sp. NCu2D-2]|uniref:amidase n=1 Tax=Acinetobacter sp. NCu2D-2 TaxID=1608473 RepID=UPI0007CDE351|nr:amidase family protein [Acinetobacter sp. NCu2D-2]ANF81736.1 amidase [Acinetobacter sp. NCu2D-2]